MEPLHATPGLLKQANLTRLRRELKKRGKATRAELAAATGISATTDVYKRQHRLRGLGRGAGQRLPRHGQGADDADGKNAERLKGGTAMTRVLFVCHGNICRSPMAEFIMRDLVTHAGHNGACLLYTSRCV